ncbi:MAG: hypothetical protein JWO30_3630 [Fibrobacteres bacterium]|nr:hypothetical protein [Fibrobacterota bacterium]
MRKLKSTWLLASLAAFSSAFAIRPDTPPGDSATAAAQAARSATFREHRLAKLERLGFKHLLDSGETDGGKRIGLKGPAEKRILERLNRRLAKVDGEVRVTQVQEDGLGNRHVRLLQYYKGIPIIGTDMVVHVDAQNRIYALGGNTAQGLSLSLSARLSVDAAEASARQALRLDLTAQSLEAPKQVIYDGKLAYEVVLPGTKPDVWQSYVDANTGEILYQANRVLHAAPVGGAQAVVHGLILPDEGGTDENIDGWLDTQNRYFLQHTANQWGVYDEDAADWEQQATPDWALNDRAAMSLGRNLALTQDYVKNVLGRNSFDDHGAFARAIVHEGTSYVNAFWDGSYLHFGDGNGTTANPLTVMDVVAHEYGHAITQYTSNLNYSGESGALNESFSDIMGTLVEFHTQPDGRSAYPAGLNGRADYLVGEDCWVSGEALRDMRNPMRYGQPSYYGGTYWAPGNDVHTNSGVQNFALFLLAEGGNAANDGHAYNIPGLGIQTAGRIALYANMFLLTSTSQYRDARDAWVLAAVTLGYDAATVSAVWTACGIAPMESHLAAAPASLDFGNVGVGSVSTLVLTLRNDAAAATLVNALAFSNPRFSTTATLPISVPAGGSVPVSVRYSPNAFAADAGTLSISSNAADHPAISVPLTGTGTAGPQASLTPPSLAFSFAPSDAPADRTATLANLGAADLTFTVSVSAQANPTASALANPGALAGMPASLPTPRNDLIYAAANYSQPFAPGQVIVAFKSGRQDFADPGTGGFAESMRELAIAKTPGTGLRSHGGRKLVLMHLAAAGAPTVQQAIAIIRSDANVEYAEPNYIRELVAIPNDAAFGNLYGMHNTGQSGGRVDADIDAPEAWDRFTGNKSLILGLIDTGIDYLHPDLAANVWTNLAELNGTPGADDDGNGFIDDVHGYDFINNDSDPMDDHYHGTHCAGTIAGVGNNGVGVAGVAWTANVAALKIFNSGGSTTDAAILNAVDYSNAMDMKITSNSWGGGPYSQSLYDLINEGRTLGHLFIAAAGNNGSNTDSSPNYPSGYTLDNIIAVAATDRNDALASFSNYGAVSVDLGAPGVDIYSCQPGNRYQLLSGTSMATPHVAGAAYLIWSYKPSLAAADVKRILLATVDPVPALAGTTLSGGRLNIARALDEAGPAWLSAAPAAGSVPGGQDRPITVTVNPAGLAAGRWTGDIAVATNDPANPSLNVHVTADISGCRNVTLTPSTLDFGNVFVGVAAARTLTLENRCNEATVVTGLAFDNAAFSTGASLPLSLAPFARVPVTIALRPSVPGTVSGLLTLTSNDGVHPVRTLALSALGVLGPMFRASATAIAGHAVPGQSVTRTLTLYNDGGLPLDWSLSGAGSTASETTEAAYGPEHFAEFAKGDEDTRVGLPVFASTGGPDAAGYRWIDSDQPGGPVYVWNDIKATGTRLSTISSCDDCSQSQALSFPFTFYGQAYSSAYIGSNGIVTFGAGSSQYVNYPLPSTSAPANLIAPFHEDLYPSISLGGVYFQDFGNKVVVQYENVPAYNGSGNYTFQVELQGNGTITYYYKSMAGTLTSCTVGIQNQTATVGLTTVYNQTYIKNGLAVRIQNAPDWITVSETSGTLAPGGSRSVGITLDASHLAIGDYATDLLVTHNGVNVPSPMVLPVTFGVLPATRGHSRILRMGTSAQVSARGASYAVARLSIGGETIGMQRGSHYHLRLR